MNKFVGLNGLLGFLQERNKSSAVSSTQQQMEIFFFYFSDVSQENKPCSSLKDSQNCKLRSIHIKNDNYISVSTSNGQHSTWKFLVSLRILISQVRCL